MQTLRKLHSSLIRSWARLHGVKIDKTCQLETGTAFQLGIRDGIKGSISLGPRVECKKGVIFSAWGGSILVGPRTFFGNYAVVYGQGGVSIGEATLVSMHCRILSSDHAIPPKAVEIRSMPDRLLPTIIGRDVWLGAGVTVLGGVTIGDGCIVGAGAVVANDLPPGSVALGIPARIHHMRS